MKAIFALVLLFGLSAQAQQQPAVAGSYEAKATWISLYKRAAAGEAIGDESQMRARVLSTDQISCRYTPGDTGSTDDLNFIKKHGELGGFECQVQCKDFKISSSSVVTCPSEKAGDNKKKGSSTKLKVSERPQARPESRPTSKESSSSRPPSKPAGTKSGGGLGG